NPDSVDESWRQFFRFAQSLAGGAAVAPGASALPSTADASLLRVASGGAALAAAIRRFGYLAVAIDPLGHAPPGSPELKAEFHGVTESELEKLPAAAVGGSEGTAADFIRHLRDLYSGSLACEFDHLGNDAERLWLHQQIESGTATTPLTAEEKRAILERLTQVDGLERFLGKAFVSMKRFSIEGVDLLVPMIDEAISAGARLGARNVVIGMAHRGRLNVLVHVIGKSYRTLLEEFDGHFPEADSESDTGDVKYHLGGSNRIDVQGVALDVELAPNPSHLEFVNPVVMGVVRARQRSASRREEARVVPIVVHGDASFPGEGVVAETLNMTMLRGYRVGGTVHLIANNQVGFTTDPTDSRSTRFASDLAKGFDIPIVHVNGDDAEAGIQATRLAMAYRAKFGKDFVIDIVGYRRHGHNESDQPSFTQPKLYEVIAGHPTPREVWGSRLVRERVVSEDEVKRLDDDFRAMLQKTYEEMKKAFASGDHGKHEGRRESPREAPAMDTSVKAEKLVSLNEQLLSWPSAFKLHPTIQRTLPRRREALQDTIDWGHAEALAFASLLTDGVGVRLTGQDAERGTFSHRQTVLHDTSTGETYTPLRNLPQARAPFEIYNSPLSETAVLGFEYGFSVAAGKSDLVLWEAQFGDFVNVAQPVIDQFIAAGRAKWRQDSSLVMLLPHGYEGQGPEHSSARLERFLQLCAEGNITVAAPSTPAQYFHILRRQAMMAERRPLILMQPKSLLRLPAAASKLDDLATKQFQPVLNDEVASEAPDQVTRLVFCSGKIFYDLTEKERPASIAVVRIEELSPWPRELSKVVDMYPNVEEVVWAQEEPKNMGAWTYVQPRLRASIGTLPMLRYIGRPERASPAEGHKGDHDHMQARIIAEVLTPSASRKHALRSGSDEGKGAGAAR
ncbi:MAG TPA: 2-oxoglutarate dehydrogenase E1 component, partial [Gemmatimonadaceae bacterium]|nr:2-oxoglutarate dehydrogenase E1 component [Gemmatimonadaceae bacterium]